MNLKDSMQFNSRSGKKGTEARRREGGKEGGREGGGRRHPALERPLLPVTQLGDFPNEFSNHNEGKLSPKFTQGSLNSRN